MIREKEESLCICGGGALGHVVAGTAATRGMRIFLLSPRAETWRDEISVHDCGGRVFRGTVAKKSSRAEDVVPEADIILLCVPGNFIRPILEKIRPHLCAGTPVGSVVSSSGFFFAAHETLPAGTPLFGFQRVPYIARTSEYGRSAELLGYKKQLRVATENFVSDAARERFRSRLETIFETPVTLLDSFWEAALTNSNPLLHPCRLFGLWRDWDGKSAFPQRPLFYEDWDDFSSETLIAADAEFFELLKKLPVSENAIPTVLDYYESSGAPSLTRKLRGISAFKGIPAPMRAVPAGGFVPDLESRYFTEDIPFGMKIIKQLAQRHDTATPVIDKILHWAGTLPPPLFLQPLNEIRFPQFGAERSRRQGKTEDAA